MQNRKQNNRKPPHRGGGRPSQGGGNFSTGYRQDTRPSAAPVAFGQAVATGRSLPSMRSNGVYTRISHAETFATVVSGSTAFEVSTYPLQPGVGSIFPWLAQVAARYETYKFRNLWFEYHTRSSTATVGTVILAFDFDAQDPAPTDQLVALSYRDSIGDTVWRPITLRLNLAEGDKLPSRYTRVAMPTGAFDLKTFDLGNLHVCTDGVPAGTVGLLEVHYTLDLFTPQVQDGMGGGFTATAGLTSNHLIGTNPTYRGALPFSATDKVITFNQKWEGVITVGVQGTGLAADVLLVPSATGANTQISKTSHVNAAATLAGVSYAVRAVRGTTLTPEMTATTVTGVTWAFSAAPYNQVSLL